MLRFSSEFKFLSQSKRHNFVTQSMEFTSSGKSKSPKISVHPTFASPMKGKGLTIDPMA